MNYGSVNLLDTFVGQKSKQGISSLVCDIPELCPGVGPSMGGLGKDTIVKMDGKDIKLNLSAVCDIPELCPGVGPSMGGAEVCDIPELCPGVGPSMGGFKKDIRLSLAVCDIPELCPGVGPSMGGFNDGKLNNLSKCTIPELCIVGNDVTSLASKSETESKFTTEEINKFKKNQSFYSGVGISNNDDGKFIDFQKPFFAFKQTEQTKSNWITATSVLCSLGLVGAGYVVVSKRNQ